MATAVGEAGQVRVDDMFFIIARPGVDPADATFL
jgi:hypothetical protein